MQTRPLDCGVILCEQAIAGACGARCRLPQPGSFAKYSRSMVYNATSDAGFHARKRRIPPDFCDSEAAQEPSEIDVLRK